MKRLIKLFTILLILGQVYPISIYSQTLNRRTRAGAVRKLRPSNEVTLASFDRFPEGLPRPVTFNIEDDNWRQATARQRLDQVRDWLLYTIISSTGLPPARIDEILYDLPFARHGYLQAVSGREYGPCRSRYVDDQHVVALVPAGSAEQRADDLAHIADKHRKDTGEIPPVIEVFEYTVDPQVRTASLTRRQEMRGQDLFTPQYGYVEGRIRGRQDLEQFLGQVDDLTFARVNGDGLTLGGRKIPGYKGISLENVATVWMADRELLAKRKQAAASDPSAEDIERRWEQKFKDLEAHWEQTTKEFRARWLAKMKPADHPSNRESDSSFTPDERQEFLHELATLLIRKNSEERQLKREMTREAEKVAVPKSAGFSLDPHFDYKGLAGYFKTQLKPTFEELAKDSRPAIDAEAINRAEQGIADEDEVPLLELVDDLQNSSKHSDRKLALRFGKEIQRYVLQTARYDGDSLRKTEVGMILFYGDLLAKLWALDFKGSSPKQYLADFKPLPDAQLSPVFLPEVLKLPDTRLWFGPQVKGYQATEAGKALVFARNATRIYAASSNPLEPGQEEEANAETGAFLGWWDDHFEEIARFEPEYEKLNEIMKWSLLMGWLNNSHNEAALSFLNTVSVNQSHWFPDWVYQHPELKFKGWDQIGFYPKGYKGTQTEAMPTLFSREYSSIAGAGYVAGGVGLGGEEAFQNRVFPSDKGIKKWIIRSDLDAEASAKPDEMKVLEGAKYEITQTAPNRSLLKAIPRAAEKLRNKFAELLGSQEFQRATVRTAARTDISQSLNGTAFSNLSIAPEGNGFKLGFKSLDVDLAHRLARQLSRSPDPARALEIHPDVEAVIKSPEGFYFVKARLMNQWMKMDFQMIGADEETGDWQAKVADFASHLYQANLSWVDEAEVKAAISQEGYIGIGEGLEGDAEAKIVSADDVPNEGLRPIEIISGRSKIHAMFDPDEQMVYFRYSQTTSDVKGLSKLLDGADLAALQKQSEVQPEGVIRYTPHPEIIPHGELTSVDLLINKGKYTDAIETLDRMKARYGDKEELTLRRGVAELGRGESQAALKILAPLFADPDRAAYQFNEVNVRLAQFDPGPDNATMALELGKDGKSDLVLRLSKELRGEPVDAKDFDQHEASVYVQDDPALSRLDWVTSINKTLHQVISGNLGTVIKAPRGSIRDFSPTVIYDPSHGGDAGEGSGGFSFKGVNHGMNGGGQPPPGKIRLTLRGPMLVCIDKDDKDKRPDEKDSDEDCIWIVIPKAS
jgi:hypothetical protein